MNKTECKTPFTQEQNDAVYRRLVAGDANARDEMIEGNMALAAFRVEEYLRNAPQMAYYRDDLIGAATYGLCEAVDSMRKKGPIRNPKPTGYLTRAIDWRITRLVDESNLIVVPQTTQDRARAEGVVIKPPRLVPEAAALGVPDSSGANDVAATELQEEILACCQDEADRKIVEMRAMNYTQKEIACEVGITQKSISCRLRAIQRRFQERNPEYADA